MKTSYAVSRSLIVIGASLSAQPAAAQLWDPLDTVPPPNAVIAHDTSVTMGIEADCSSCHNPGDRRTRLDLSRRDLLQTLPLFKDYFVFGSFQYSGCDYAKVNPGSRILPTPSDPDSSYNAVINQVAGAVHCGSRENRFPAGASSSGCLTATPSCIGDILVIRELMNGQLRGFDPASPWTAQGCSGDALRDWCPDCQDQTEGGPCMWTGASPNPMPAASWADVQAGMPNDPSLVNMSTCTQGYCFNPVLTCDGGGSYQVQASLIAKLQRIAWPRWYEGRVSPQDVRRELCDPIEQAYNEVANEMRACSAYNTVILPALNGQSWCVPGQIAGNACDTSSPLMDTCVCNNENALCEANVRVSSNCGNPLTWKARQQFAVCETYDTSAPDRFGSFFRTQPDNVVNAGGCRENVAMFFTDGYMGGTPGTTVEALAALPTYTSYGGLSNMFVFRVSNVFNGDADAMMTSITRGEIRNSYSATDLVNMQVSFARILNRVYKGVFTGAAMGTDTFGTRAAFHSFTVPGYTLGAPIGDDYLGWPARISWHEIRADGSINMTPIFETDWQTKATGNSSCGVSYNLPGLANAATQLGPGGTFRNGVSRNAVIAPNFFDRNGDGLADTHRQLQFGRMFSIASTQPIVVEAPRLSPEGQTATDLLAFMQSARTRPRMIYVMSNGYLHGYEAGTYSSASGRYGMQKLAFTYNDSGATAGTEVFRYAPRWLDDPQPGNTYDYAMNNLVQQPMINGQLTASDVRIRSGGSDRYRTVLVGSQGKAGRGMFSVDVTEPCRATLLGEWVLPSTSDKASNEPSISIVPMNTDPKMRPAVVVTGGLGGTNNIYAFDVANGALLFDRALPAGSTYPTAPTCVDVTGEGRVTHCYVLREDGRLIRVEVTPGAFGSADDITPPEVGAGLVFSTSPTVYFGPDGAVNLAFGSGDFRNLTTAGGQNFMYKAIDRNTRVRGLTAAAADVGRACGGSSSGEIRLGANERVISPPIVSKGVVAWTTYSPQSTGCVSGNGNVYAMKYDSCGDALAPGNTRPVARATGAGIPAEPMLHRASQRLIVSTSAGPTAAQTISFGASTRGGLTPIVKRLFWRPELDIR